MTKRFSPDERTALVPYLTIRDCPRAIGFYQRVFGAVEEERSHYPGSEKIMHAELRIGGARLMLSEEFLDWGNPSPQALKGSPVSLMLYVEDVDLAFEAAMMAGATSLVEPQDTFWGDRFAKIVDPFGHIWGLSHHQKVLSTEEKERAAEAHFSSFDIHD